MPLLDTISGRPRGMGKVDRSAKEHVGQLARVIFAADDGGYCVLALADGSKVNGKSSADNFRDGLTYRFFGRWADSKFGPQFTFETFAVHVPAGRNGIITYLLEFAENVGRKTAEKLFDRYGPDAIDILRKNPDRVATDGVMAIDLARDAARSLATIAGTEKTRVELFDLFKGRGFPGKLIDRMIDEWGAKAGEMVRRDPFRLLVKKLPGCGFKRCDKLWCDLGKPRNALKRQTIAAWNAIRNDTNGHTWLSMDAVVEIIQKEIAGETNPKRAVKLGIRSRWLSKFWDASGKLWIADGDRARAELRIAEQIKELNRGQILWPASIPTSQQEGDGLPSEHQRDEVIKAVRTPAAILAGTPGTGKTHTLAFVLKQVIEQHGANSVAVCAPTGKAAIRARQSLQRLGISLPATTIHRLLKIGRSGRDGDGWEFEHKRGNPLPFKFVICDETSMQNTDLMSDLLDACAPPSIAEATEEIRVPAGGMIPPRCRKCRRVLTDPESWKIGFGPECAKRVSPDMYSPVDPIPADEEVVFPAAPAINLPGTHVLFIGDPYQLAPVGHGAPFRDLIDSGSIGYGELSQVRRNAGQIVHACVRIKNNEEFETTDKADFESNPPRNLRMIPARTPEKAVDALEQLLSSMRKFHPVWQTQVIVPLNKKSKVSRVELNKRLQGLLNPTGIEAKPNPFRVGDKIICLRNGFIQLVKVKAGHKTWRRNADSEATEPLPTDAKAYEQIKIKGSFEKDDDGLQEALDAAGVEGCSGDPAELYVANGEIGRVVAVSDSLTIARFSESEWLVKIPMAKPKPGQDGADESEGEQGRGSFFDLAYAVSGHKMQGSEAPCCIVMIDDTAGFVASKEWVYTSISRAAKLCVLIGDEAVLKRQARKTALVKRKTFLKEILLGASGERSQ